MLLHIGSDAFVSLRAIIAVLDIASQPRLAKEPATPQDNGCTITRIGTERIKSVIVTESNGRRVFFLSPISAQTLRKRVENGLA